jgi:hypothetical protein
VIVSFSTESGIIMVDFLEDGFNPSFKLMIKYFGGDCKHVTFTIASFIDYQCKEFPEEKRSHVLKDRSDCGGMALMFQKNMMGVFQFGHQLESKYFREANADCFPKNKPENKNKYMSWLRKQFQNIENRYEPLCEAIFHEDFVSPNKKKKREKVHFDRI